MIDAEKYIRDLTEKCKETFSERLLYVGLQGSYLRNEANENSDIDIMVVIDKMTVSDLYNYRNVLSLVGDFDKSCGFICGKEELSGWNPLEICQLLHTTRDYYGKLEKLVPPYTIEDEINYVKLSLGNLYHELCHRYVHSDRKKNISKLPMSDKQIFYIVQNIQYLNGGNFIAAKRELLECVCYEDKKILKLAEWMKSGSDYDFDEAFAALFKWCQDAFIRVSRLQRIYE